MDFLADYINEDQLESFISALQEDLELIGFAVTLGESGTIYEHAHFLLRLWYLHHERIALAKLN